MEIHDGPSALFFILAWCIGLAATALFLFASLGLGDTLIARIKGKDWRAVMREYLKEW